MTLPRDPAGLDWQPVEVIASAVPTPNILLSCEHASNRLPPGMAWPAADHRLVDDHWAWDPGAAEIVRRVVRELGCPAVLSGFSRLVIDPNRPLDSETLFRTHADGLEIGLNAGLTADDRAARTARCYAPYHAAMRRMFEAHPGVDVLSVHTYTPSYEGQRREVELGVLFDIDEDWAEVWFEVLASSPYDVRRNEPWSGRRGLMYSPQHHATRAGVRAMELEVRQDLATDPVHQAAIAALVVQAIRTATAR